MISGEGGNVALYATERRRHPRRRHVRSQPRRHPRAGEDGHRQAAEVRHQHTPARRPCRRRLQDAADRRSHRASERLGQSQGHEAAVLRGHAGHADRAAADHVLRRARRASGRQGSAGALLRSRSHERRRRDLLSRAQDHSHRRPLSRDSRRWARRGAARQPRPPGVPIYVDYVAGRQLSRMDEDARWRADAGLRHRDPGTRSRLDQGRRREIQGRSRDDAQSAGRADQAGQQQGARS